MTGKDLIIYILQNNLENEDVFKDRFIDLETAAAKFNVGVETIKVWATFGHLKSIKINNQIYILKDYWKGQV